MKCNPKKLGLDCFGKGINRIKYIPSNKNLEFFFFGCWGINCGDSQVRVRELMKSLYEKDKNISFIACAGDNKYPKYHKKAPFDEEFYEKYGLDYHYFKNFLECYESLDIPWYVVLGNHDTKECRDMISQVNYEYYDANGKWIMPSPYWSIYYENVRGKSVQFLFIDTSSLIDEYIDDLGEVSPTSTCNTLRNKEELEDIRKNYIPTDITYNDIINQRVKNFPNLTKESKDQINWFRDKLNMNCDINIVIGHHPIIANGHKAKKSTIENKGLFPILSEIVKFNKKGNGKVQAYMCADEHNMQFLYDDRVGLSYVINGAGGTDLDETIFESDKLKEFTKFTFSKNHGVCKICIGEKKISIKYYTIGEKLLKEISLDFKD